MREPLCSVIVFAVKVTPSAVRFAVGPNTRSVVAPKSSELPGSTTIVPETTHGFPVHRSDGIVAWAPRGHRATDKAIAASGTKRRTRNDGTIRRIVDIGPPGPRSTVDLCVGRRFRSRRAAARREADHALQS